MKICYIGVADSHLKKLSIYFSRRGHEVHLITWNFMGVDTHILDGVDGVTVHYLGGNNPKFNKWFFPLTTPKIIKILREIQPDILHTLYLLPYSVHGVLCGFHPHIAAAWGSDVLVAPQKNPIFKHMVKLVLAKADRINSVSPLVSTSCIRLGADASKIFIAPIGVDTKLFTPSVDGDVVRRQLRWEKNPIIICTRNFEGIYNIDILINAMPYILEKKPDVRLILLGSGSLEDRFKQMVKKFGLVSAVKFTGYVPNEQVPKYLAASDVYVSPTLSDGLSVSNLEAMACGVFPIITDIPVAKYIITHGVNGFIAPTDSPKKLAELIVEALDDDKLREKAAEINRRMVEEKYDLNVLTAQLEEEYRKLASKVC